MQKNSHPYERDESLLPAVPPYLAIKAQLIPITAAAGRLGAYALKPALPGGVHH